MKITRKRYYAINFILLFVVLAISFIVALVVMYRGQRQATDEKTTLLTEQANIAINDTLNDIDMLSRTMFLDEEFQDSADRLYEDRNALEAIYRHFNIFISMDDFYKNAIYVPRNEEGEIDIENAVTYGIGYEYIQYNLSNIVRLAEQEENQKGRAFFTQLYLEDGEIAPYYAIARNVYDVREVPSHLQKMGIGIIFINSGHLVEILNTYSLALDGLEFCILGREGVIATSMNFQESVLENDAYNRKGHALNNFDWKLMSVFETSYIWKGMRRNFIVLVFIMSFAGLTCVLLAVVAKRKSSQSLDYLFNTFSGLKRDKAIEVISRSDDEEVNRVIDSFNGLVTTLKNLNDEMLKQKNKELTLELQNVEYMLNSLHAQINKHFLINILSLLRFFVNSGELQKAKNCIEDLSDFLRGALSVEDTSTIGQELAMVRSYLNIQTNRYPRVQYEIVCSEEYLNMDIPKMLLQPVIENALVHGLQKKEGKIRVVCKIKANFVRFSVIDNGQGIVQERVKEINQSLKQGKKIEFASGNGIALHNVAQRLRLLTGEKSSLYIMSRKGRGTIVTLKIYNEQWQNGTTLR